MKIIVFLLIILSTACSKNIEEYKIISKETIEKIDFDDYFNGYFISKNNILDKNNNVIKEYKNISTYNKYLVVENEKYYLLDNKLNVIYESNDYIYLYEEANMFEIGGVLYNINGEKIYKSDLIMDINDNMILSSGENDCILYDINSKKTFKNVLCQPISINNEILYVTNNSFIDTKGNIFEKEYKINDRYKLDICEYGTRIKRDDIYLQEECLTSYDISLIDKDVIGVSNDLSTAIYFNNKRINFDYYQIINGKIIANKNIYNENGNIIKSINCNYIYQYKDKYICDDKFILNENLNPIKMYDNIICNENYCIIENNNLYGLYIDDVVIEPTYLKILNKENLLIASNLFSVDMIRLGLTKENYEYEISDLKPYLNVDYENKNIKEEDLELFKKYYYLINNQKEKERLINLFDIVAKNKKYMNEKYFLNNLSNLKIENVTTMTPGNAGEYYSDTNTIKILENTDRVVYHELIHFLDFKFNEPKNYYYVCDGKISNNTSCDINYIETPKFILEGGAEVYMARYYNNEKTVVYSEYTHLYYIFEYLFKEEVMEEIFFSFDGNLKFINLLLENGISYEEIMNLNDDYNQMIKILLKIHKDYENDLFFKMLLSGYLNYRDSEYNFDKYDNYQNFLKSISSYDNGYYEISYKDNIVTIYLDNEIIRYDVKNKTFPL